VPNNGVVVPPKFKEVPNTRELGTARAYSGMAVLDSAAPFCCVCYKAGMARACGGTAVPTFQLPF